MGLSITSESRPPARDYRYSAFISYSHLDEDFARWLHKHLESYRPPRRIWGHRALYGLVGGKLAPVFRDREEFASSANLAASVQAALEEAACLIVICSPNAAKSRWVNQEVTTFLDGDRSGRIFCIIHDGEPHAANSDQECLPSALREAGSVEPLAADARKGGDGKRVALLKLLAGILDLPFDELRQREAQRRQRRLLALTAASLAGLVLMTGLAAFAFVSRNQAVEQRDLARKRTLTARRTAAFVTDLFRSADPSQIQGRNLSIGEVLDTGESQVRSSLREEPSVRADFATTLADVYGSIGEFERAASLARWSTGIPHREPDVAVRQWTVLARTSIWLGNYENGAAEARRAVAIANAAGESLDPELLPRALIVLGEAEGEAGDIPAARTALRRAVAIAGSGANSGSSDYALALEALARVEAIDRDNVAAAGHFERAMKIRLANEGNLSPSVTDIARGLAQIATQAGRPGEAERLLRDRVQVSRQILGPNHRDTAILSSDLARSFLEQGKFRQAKPLFQSSLAVFKNEPGMDYNIAASYYNLGVTNRYLGLTGKSQESFQNALSVAAPAEAGLRGLVLAELGDLQCQTGRRAEGKANLRAAEPMVRASFPDDPWRIAWVRIASLTCDPDARGSDEGAQIRRLRATINQRWPTGTLYRTIVDRRIGRSDT